MGKNPVHLVLRTGSFNWKDPNGKPLFTETFQRALERRSTAIFLEFFGKVFLLRSRVKSPDATLQLFSLVLSLIMSMQKEELMSIHGLDQLRFKRTYRKGNIKKMDNYLTSISDKSILDINLMELDTKLQSLDETLEAYDIQWKIAQKADPELVKTEEESVIAQRDTSKAIRVNLTNKIKAVMVARKLKVVQDNVNDLLHCSEFASTTDLDLLSEARANFRPLQEEGQDYKVEPGMSELVDELSLKIKQLNDRARKATVERPTMPSSISFPKLLPLPAATQASQLQWGPFGVEDILESLRLSHLPGERHD